MVMMMVIPIMPKQAVTTDMMIFRVGDFFSAATIGTRTTGSTATTVPREEQLLDGESFGLGTTIKTGTIDSIATTVLVEGTFVRGGKLWTRKSNVRGGKLWTGNSNVGLRKLWTEKSNKQPSKKIPSSDKADTIDHDLVLSRILFLASHTLDQTKIEVETLGWVTSFRQQPSELELLAVLQPQSLEKNSCLMGKALDWEVKRMRGKALDWEVKHRRGKALDWEVKRIRGKLWTRKS
ncbi:hypothetical protein Tco_0889807 [Tanacetum coccineum]